MNTRVLLCLFGFGGALAMACGYAHADSLDDVYLQSLHEVGIYSGNGDAGLIALGHFTCNAFLIGESFNDAKTVIVSNNPHLTSTGAGQVIGAATAVYCPGFAYKFGGTPPAAVAPWGTGVVA